MKLRATGSLGLLTAAAVTMTVGCGQSPANQPGAASAQASASEASCQLSTAGSSIRPLDTARSAASGPLALGKLQAKTVALVADEDAKELVVVDIDAQKELSRTPLGATPAHVLILDDGRVAVSLRDRAEIAVFEVRDSGQADKRCGAPTALEPIALSSTGNDLLVTSGWSATLTRHDGTTLARTKSIELPREPRAVVVSDDGSMAYVSHAVGSSISLVDLEHNTHRRSISLIVNPDEMRHNPVGGVLDTVSSMLLGRPIDEDIVPGRFGTRAGCQGYALAKTVQPEGRILAPQVLVDPGDPENRGGGYGDGHTPTEIANVAVIDDPARGLVPASAVLTDEQVFNHMNDPSVTPERDCMLPRAAAVDDKTGMLLVTCYGIGSVVAYDAGSANPAMIELNRWEVGAGPSGIAVDGEKHRAVVWSQFDRSLEIINLDVPMPLSSAREGVASIDLATKEGQLAYEIRLGRQLFHAIGDQRISKDGRACASCHPDGRDDAITWATPDGPRRTKMLAGRLAGTAPYSWSNQHDSLDEHIVHTFDRLGGQGLRGMELEALKAYLDHVDAPPQVATLSSIEKQGRDIFFSSEAACSSCHMEEQGYGDTHLHDVKSRANADGDPKFNTPSLRYLAGRAPYFHDGRYASLRELLRDTDGDMGHTAHLDAKQVEALEAFLKTL